MNERAQQRKSYRYFCLEQSHLLWRSQPDITFTASWNTPWCCEDVLKGKTKRRHLCLAEPGNQSSSTLRPSAARLLIASTHSQGELSQANCHSPALLPEQRDTKETDEQSPALSSLIDSIIHSMIVYYVLYLSFFWFHLCFNISEQVLYSFLNNMCQATIVTHDLLDGLI